jgi:lysophospholipase L1-like esterase
MLFLIFLAGLLYNVHCNERPSPSLISSPIASSYLFDDSCINAYAGKSIVALGDSLTRGFTLVNSSNSLFDHFPYSDEVASVLSCVVHNWGQDGENTEDMRKRLLKILEGMGPSEPMADVWVILGGTNDLIRAESDLHRNEMLANILDMHDMVKSYAKARHHPVATVMLAVPPVARLTATREKFRLFVNEGLHEYSKASLHGHTHEHDGKNKLLLGPNDSSITAFVDTGDIAMDWLGKDGIHFTQDGYKEIGRRVLNILCQLV